MGEKGKCAVTSYLEQLHDIKTFEPLNSNELNKKYRAFALVSLIFLTEKGMA